jgi:serine/threonine-protein kinase HipA
MRPLDELRDIECADVFKQGRRAGSLRRRADAVVFTYHADYIDDGGPAIATTLPPGPDPLVTHAAGALPPFFAGLLPEGRRLTALRTAVKTSADDDFTLLLAVGGDTVGDVQIFPEGMGTTAIAPVVSVESWDQVRFADLFSASVGGGPETDRVGLPGVQVKVSARMINVPVAHRNRSFILKLDAPEFPNLVANEAFFLEAARRSGIPCAESQIVRDQGGTAGLLVRRFDRVIRHGDPEGEIHMLAQEDACQVLSRYPADKYRFSTEEAIEALAQRCRARPVAALALLRQVAFAYLSCNGDAHGKNLSIQHVPEGEWRVTPAYDLPCSYLYGDTTMALAINGRRREDIGLGDFLALGEAVGLPQRAVRRALAELRDRVELWIGDLGELPFDEGRLHKLRKAIEYRRTRLGG